MRKFFCIHIGVRFAVIWAFTYAFLCVYAFGNEAFGQGDSQSETPQLTAFNPAYIDADSFIQDTENGIVIAQGDVVFVRGEFEVYADEMRYNESQDHLEAQGHVAARVPGEGLMFASRLVLSNGQKDGYATDVQWQLPRGQTATAERIDIIDGDYILKGATFTSCQLCEGNEASPPTKTASTRTHGVEPTPKIVPKAIFSQSGSEKPKRIQAQGAPIWSFTAPSGHQSGDRMSYNWPYLSVGGVPIVVAPYFSHISGAIRRAPGLLTPKVGSSTLLGTYVTFRGYVPLTKTSDLIVYASPSSESAFRAGGTYARSISGGNFTIGGSYAPGFRRHLRSVGIQEDGENSWHASAAINKQLTESLQMGASLLRASDSHYVSAYGVGGSLLTSSAYLKFLHRRDYWQVEGISFQDFRTVGAHEKAPIVLPRFTSEIYGKSGRLFGGTPYGRLDLLALFRPKDQDTALVNMQVGWRRYLGTHRGIIFNSHSWARADRYLTNYSTDIDDNETPPASGTINEGRSQIASVLDARAPIYFETAETPVGPITQFLTPSLKVRLSNRASRSKVIPNNDNTIVELDDQTLQQDNWYPGLDRIDDISRTVGSLSHSVYFGRAISASQLNWTSTLSAARTLESYDYEELTNSGLIEDGRAQRTTPLYFGSHMSAPWGYEIDYRTVLIEQANPIWFQDFGIGQVWGPYQWEALISEASQGPGQESLGELQASAKAKPVEFLEASLSLRHRLYGEEERLRQLKGKLSYIHECFELELSYAQTWSSALNDFDREWLVTGSLKNLGR